MGMDNRVVIKSRSKIDKKCFMKLEAQSEINTAWVESSGRKDPIFDESLISDWVKAIRDTLLLPVKGYLYGNADGILKTENFDGEFYVYELMLRKAEFNEMADLNDFNGCVITEDPYDCEVSYFVKEGRSLSLPKDGLLEIKTNLDKRICDVEEGAVNEDTYRDFLKNGWESLGFIVTDEDLDSMCNEELNANLEELDWLLSK